MLALKSGDDDLAREALKQKQRSRKKAEEVRARANGSASTAEQMKDTLERIEQKIEDLEARKASLASQVRKARETPGTSPGGSRFGSGSDTFDELERMAGRIDQLDAEVEVHGILEDDEVKAAELEAKFRKLERSSGDSAVEDELAALKSKLD